jgi:hypothetical protein
MKRMLHGIVVVLIGMMIGKWRQYAAVEYLGGRLGFHWVSIIGLAPSIVALVVPKAKYPHALGYRRHPQRS